MSRLFTSSLIVFLFIFSSCLCNAAPGEWNLYNNLYKKGTITVVTFFSLSSESSQALVRQVDALAAAKSATDEIDFIGVLIDPNDEPGRAAKEFVSTLGMRVCAQQSRFLASFGYNTSSIGMVVVVDRDGNYSHVAHSGSTSVASDIMAKVAAYRQAANKQTEAPKAADDGVNCAALERIVSAAEAADFSRLNNLSLPEAQGIGTPVADTYMVYLHTGLSTPDGAYNKVVMKQWSDRISKCLPAFLVREQGASGFADLLKDDRYQLPPILISGLNVSMKIYQQEALRKTNIMLKVWKR